MMYNPGWPVRCMPGARRKDAKFMGMISATHNSNRCPEMRVRLDSSLLTFEDVVLQINYIEATEEKSLQTQQSVFLVTEQSVASYIFIFVDNSSQPAKELYICKTSCHDVCKSWSSLSM